MANIEFKSKKEQLYRNDFNPYVASKEEVEDDLKEQKRLFKGHANHLGYLVGEELLKKIADGALGSYPFDKKLIYNSNLKSIDNVNRYDFKDEASFIEALEVYYELLIVMNNIDNDNIALKSK